MMKDEEARRITTVEAFMVADKKSQELTTKMTESQVPSPNYYYYYYYCRGKGPGLRIGLWALSEGTNRSKKKQIITRYSQTKFH